MRIHHVVVRVCDLLGAVAFWQRTSGAVIARADPDIALLRLSNAYLALARCDAQPERVDVHVPGLTHVCLQAKTMDPLYARVSKAGATFHSAPQHLANGNGYVYARDDEHNVIELEALPAAPERQAPWLAHVAFASRDALALAEFYAGLVGGALRAGSKLGPNRVFDAILGVADAVMTPYWVRGPNITLEFWQFDAPVTEAQRAAQGTGYAGIALDAADLPAAVARATRLGARVAEPGSVYASGHAHLRDPDGNSLLLFNAEAHVETSLRACIEPDIVDYIRAREA